MNSGVCAGAGGEEVDVALERRLEDDLRRVGDRVGRGLEAGRDDPEQRQQRDDRVERDQRRRRSTSAAATAR